VSKKHDNETDIPWDVKPDWAYWLALPFWTLHEAVALSVGISPAFVSDDLDVDTMNPSDANLDRQLSRKAKRHDDILRRWVPVPVEQGGLRHDANSATHRIKPSDLIALCFRLNLSVPTELRSGGFGSSSAANCWPWGDYETKLLLILAEAVQQWWTTYDPEDPATAPKKDDVVEWLKNRLNRKDSETLAGYIATIIRADDAPTGRRKTSRD
jgi:hypothetical protein